MDKFIFVDVKKLKKKYLTRILVLCIPFVQFFVVVLFIMWLNSMNPQKPTFDSFARTILFWNTLSFVVFLIISLLITAHLIKAHKRNTFIHIFNHTLIISRHVQTVYNGFKREYYKKLYVIDLTKLDSIALVKGNIVIKGHIREFYEKSDWLYYTLSDRGITFDTWWFNYNSSVLINHLELNDIFPNTPKLLKRIRKISKIEKARFERRQKFHEQMLELAKNSVIKKSALRKYPNRSRYR